MTRRTKLAAGLAAAAALALGGAAIAGSGDDGSLSPAEADEASAAALRATGGGEVLEQERGDDGAAFEVEVRKPDGSTVEVQLDASYDVVAIEADDDNGDDEGPDDDKDR
jgi:uncharacterized membrane protein YkoI